MRRFIHSNYKGNAISISLTQIVAVTNGSEGRTFIYCTDKEEYVLSEPYDLIMRKIEECVSDGRRNVDDIHADERETAARQVYRAVMRQERPDIAVAMILNALDIWYRVGVEHGSRSTKLPEEE